MINLSEQYRVHNYLIQLFISDDDHVQSHQHYMHDQIDQGICLFKHRESFKQYSLLSTNDIEEGKSISDADINLQFKTKTSKCMSSKKLGARAVTLRKESQNTSIMLKNHHQNQKREDQHHFQKKETVKPGRMKEARHSPAAENQEQLITEYDKREFKDKRIKAAIIQHQNQYPRKDKEAYETRGGICFELDTRLSKGNPKASPPRPKKKKTDQFSRAGSVSSKLTGLKVRLVFLLIRALQLFI